MVVLSYEIRHLNAGERATSYDQEAAAVFDRSSGVPVAQRGFARDEVDDHSRSVPDEVGEKCTRSHTKKNSEDF